MSFGTCKRLRVHKVYYLQLFFSNLLVVSTFAPVFEF